MIISRRWILILQFLFFSLGFASAATIAKNGVAKTVIIIDPAATQTEVYAAHQLAECLGQITGATFNILTNTKAPAHAILVGRGKAASSVFRDVPFADLGDEELVICAKGGRLLLAGGRPRGTLYAVSRFLQDECGVRWWTPWASRVPRQPNLTIKDINVRLKPAFEYRDPYWFTAFDPDWSWRNLCNGLGSKLTADKGGCVTYAGSFVHTFYPLVPPDKYFASHPEWYSLVNGKRTDTGAQLCLTYPQLREFMVKQVRDWLHDSPDANIVSISQNDCFGACECSNCAAVDNAEGSHSGTMIAFVNDVAEKLKPEFPQVAFDTLAYQYTRKPPKTVRPDANVIVRLCSIECNFREPLDQPANAAFADDIRGWAEKTGRLYVWDYVTDFHGYVQPFPDWFTLGPNLRFFQANHVRGIFEEGAYQSYGSEMGELRAWVLAQLMWNPQQDDRTLIREFLDGYYGAAGKPIAQYLELLNDASKGYDLNCGAPIDAPFLDFKPLAEAEKLWRQAEAAVAGDQELTARVLLGHLPVQYVWLARWDALKKECSVAGAPWPFSESEKNLADHWHAVTEGTPDKPWTRVTMLNEGGETPEQFLTHLDLK
jgi:hypothetical protein